MNSLLMALALVQGSLLNTSIGSVSGTKYASSGTSTGECYVSAYAAYNNTDQISTSTGMGRPVLNLIVSSSAMNNPSSVKFKIRYSSQTQGDGDVFQQNDPNDKGSAKATATGATDVSFSLPRFINGTQTYVWSDHPPQKKAKTIWYPVQLPSFVQTGGQYHAAVSVPLKCDLFATASANGSGRRKDEAIFSSRASLFVNVLSTYPIGISHHANGHVASSMPNVSVDIYQTNGSFIDSYLVNSASDNASTYDLDFQDFQGTAVNAFFYVTGSLRTKVTFDTTADQPYDFAPVMGDVDGDGTIDQTDIDLLYANLGCTIDTMNTAGTSFDFDAYDLDRDGIITTSDIAIAEANFGLSSDH